MSDPTTTPAEATTARIQSAQARTPSSQGLLVARDAPDAHGVMYVTRRRSIVTPEGCVRAPIAVALAAVGDARGERVRVTMCGPRAPSEIGVMHASIEVRGVTSTHDFNDFAFTPNRCSVGVAGAREYSVAQAADVDDLPCEGTHALVTHDGDQALAGPPASVAGTPVHVRIWFDAPADLQGTRFVIDQRVVDPAVTAEKWNAYFQSL